MSVQTALKPLFDPHNSADGLADWDGDGLTNAEEFALGTDFLNLDTDGDGFDDGIEIFELLSDPLDPFDPAVPITAEADPTPQPGGNGPATLPAGGFSAPGGTPPTSDPQGTSTGATTPDSAPGTSGTPGAWPSYGSSPSGAVEQEIDALRSLYSKTWSWEVQRGEVSVEDFYQPLRTIEHWHDLNANGEMEPDEKWITYHLPSISYLATEHRSTPFELAAPQDSATFADSSDYWYSGHTSDAPDPRAQAIEWAAIRYGNVGYWHDRGHHEAISHTTIASEGKGSTERVRIKLKEPLPAEASPFKVTALLVRKKDGEVTEVTPHTFVVQPGQQRSELEVELHPLWEEGAVHKVVLVSPEVSMVYENDQKWNRSPNPKRPHYSNEAGIDPKELSRSLFVAVEPESNKAEIIVQLKEQILSNANILCAVEFKGNVLKSCSTFDKWGKAKLQFTPAESINESPHQIRVGFDSDKSGDLSMGELFPKADDDQAIRVATAEDISKNLASLITRSDLRGGIASEFLDFFLGRSPTLGEGNPQQPHMIPIVAPTPTHIAGSPYEPESGTTSIPSFNFGEGTRISNLIEDEFSLTESHGLYPITRKVWRENYSTIWRSMTSDGEKDFTFHISRQPISFYYRGFHALRLALGTATLSAGRLAMRCRKRANQVIVVRISIQAKIEDVYDFDFTRPIDSASRKGAIIQIGWEPPARHAGRIFHSTIEIDKTYDETTTYPDLENDQPINFFNKHGIIDNGNIVEPSNEHSQKNSTLGPV